MPTIKHLIANIPVEITYKRVKYLRLRVMPMGAVRISAPLGTPLDQIQHFVAAKQGWINRKRGEQTARELPQPARFHDGEVHYLWGAPVALTSGEHKAVELEQSGHLALPDVDMPTRRSALFAFYHRQLQQRLTPMLADWCAQMQVEISHCSIKPMKTRWGSCNIQRRRINLSLELAQKPAGCLEMVLVHELVHLFERGHNARFYGLMDHYLPDWREQAALLKYSPGMCCKTCLFKPAR